MANIYDADLGNVRSELITNGQGTSVSIDRELETLNFSYSNGSKKSKPLPFSNDIDWMGYAFWLAGNDNNFLLVYNGERVNGGEVLGQLFNYNGSKIGGEIIFSSQTNQGHRPSAYVLEDGRYIILWQTNNPLGSPELGDRIGYIVGRIVSLDLKMMGDTFVVATGINLLVDAPTIQLNGRGDIQVLFNARSDIAIADNYFTAYGTVTSDIINGSDQAESIFSGNGDDLVNGLAGNDYIDSGEGDDEISGGLGDDKMVGGTGDDTYHIDSSKDTISEQANEGEDTVISNLKTYNLGEEIENLIFDNSAISATGNETDNVIEGNSKNNKIEGAAGDDTLLSGTGNDTVSGGSGNDIILTGDGNDKVDAGAGNDVIIGGDGAGNDTYNGGEGIDTVKYTSALAGISVDLNKGTAKSTTGNDTAGIGSDKLSNIENVIAGNYADTITGSKVSNTLTGGYGNDTFIFNTKLNAQTNVDTITDFTSGDKIALAGSIFSKLKADKDLSDNFALNSSNTVKEYLIYNSSTGKLYYDADGNANKSQPIEVAIIGVDSHPTLTASDFSII